MKILIIGLLSVLSLKLYAGLWLKGDLHVHTIYSGGDSTVSEIDQFAKSYGLDFVAITDHDNKMKGLPLAWPSITKNESSTLVLYGMEWTHGMKWTDCHGHMNLWSTKPFDYKKFWEENENDDALKAMQMADEENILYSINHPNLIGFAWNYEFPSHLPSMEIWNGRFALGSSRATIEKQWRDYYAKGIRVTGVGGSDVHKLKNKNTQHTLGNPTTWVYAENKTSEAILSGIRKGHVLITFAPQAPVALLKIGKAMSGDNLFIKRRGKIPLTIESLSEAKSSAKVERVILFKNGLPYKSWEVGNQFKINLDETLTETYAWYSVELHGDMGFKGAKKLFYGSLLSLSNPITINFN